ncbi:MAG: hypothetical protein AB7U82_20200 [Blastocatellales bacterium]
MRSKLEITAKHLIPAFCLIALLSASLTARVEAAPQDEQTRRLWDSEFFKAKKTGPSKRRYRVATPRIPTDRVDGDSVLGITLWRLRPSRTTDDKEVRLFKHPTDDTRIPEWTPERISVNTPLAVGQRVRLSIEAARTGYLYVIDRELYADGTLGDPHLIFPTSRLRGGDNKVSVGRIVDIPALEDEPNYFILDPDRPELVGEVISVLVTPRPLANIRIGDAAIKLSKNDVATWEKLWGAQVGRLEMEGSLGKAWTKEEKDASKGQTLKQNSPAPQTLYYRPAAKPDESLMVSVRLRYGSARAKAR